MVSSETLKLNCGRIVEYASLTARAETKEIFQFKDEQTHCDSLSKIDTDLLSLSRINIRKDNSYQLLNGFVTGRMSCVHSLWSLCVLNVLRQSHECECLNQEKTDTFGPLVKGTDISEQPCQEGCEVHGALQVFLRMSGSNYQLSN